MSKLNFLLIVILLNCLFNFPTNGHSIQVVRGDSFWLECLFDFENVETPWTVTIRKAGNLPNDIYRIDSDNNPRISPWNQTGIEIINATHISLLIDGADGRSFGDYECELIDHESSSYLYSIQVIEVANDLHSDSVSLFRVRSSQLYWIQLITLYLIVFFIFK